MATRRLFMRTQLAAHLVRSVADRRCKDELGVSAAQLGVLFTVVARPHSTQRDVAAALGLQETALVRLVGRMVDDGFLEREHADGRSYALTVTPRGADAASRARPLVAEVERRLSEGFTDAELDVVERFLTAAAAAFTKDPR
jgi:DNA-binding MarR family transcriptional regulator